MFSNSSMFISLYDFCRELMLLKGPKYKANFSSVIFYIFGAWGIFIILAIIMARLLTNGVDED